MKWAYIWTWNDCSTCVSLYDNTLHSLGKTQPNAILHLYFYTRQQY